MLHVCNHLVACPPTTHQTQSLAEPGKMASISFSFVFLCWQAEDMMGIVFRATYPYVQRQFACSCVTRWILDGKKVWLPNILNAMILENYLPQNILSGVEHQTLPLTPLQCALGPCSSNGNYPVTSVLIKIWSPKRAFWRAKKFKAWGALISTCWWCSGSKEGREKRSIQNI